MMAWEGRPEIAGQLAQTGTPPRWINDYLALSASFSQRERLGAALSLSNG